MIPEDLTEENEEKYLYLFENPTSTLPLQNIVEYLILSGATSLKEIGFWMKLSLHYSDVTGNNLD